VGRDLGLDGVVDHFTLPCHEAGWLPEQKRRHQAGLRRPAEISRRRPRRRFTSYLAP